jgi:hypothetical protein
LGLKRALDCRRRIAFRSLINDILAETAMGVHGQRRFREWRRDNVSSEDDWLTLRYGWHDTVVESCLTAGNLFRALRRRGYTGQLGCCLHCKV